MPNPMDSSSTSQPQSSFDCEFCPELFFSTATELAHHAASMHDRWECVVPSCQSEPIKGYGNLVTHVQSKDPPLGKVVCNMCNKESETFANWRRHASQKHGGGMPAAMELSNRQMTSGQREDVKPPTIKSGPREENVTQDQAGQDVEESPTTENSGRSGGDDAVGSFRCRACFCRLEDGQGALIHAEEVHKEADGTAQCPVCQKPVTYDEYAKHGFQEHIQEFLVHCPFCIDQMTYIDLILHVMLCPMRPQELDLATVRDALKEGRVPGSLSEPEVTRTSDTTRPENCLDSVASPEEPIIPGVAGKKEQPSVFKISTPELIAV